MAFLPRGAATGQDGSCVRNYCQLVCSHWTVHSSWMRLSQSPVFLLNQHPRNLCHSTAPEYVSHISSSLLKIIIYFQYLCFCLK